jgi:hypothetical protein
MFIVHVIRIIGENKAQKNDLDAVYKCEIHYLYSAAYKLY